MEHPPSGHYAQCTLFKLDMLVRCRGLEEAAHQALVTLLENDDREQTTSLGVTPVSAGGMTIQAHKRLNELSTKPFDINTSSNSRQGCRLFTIPAELRNAIYGELLLFQEGSNGQYCWPSILATCRQAYKEGYSVLYGGNEFTVKMRMCYEAEPDDSDEECSLPIIETVAGRKLSTRDDAINSTEYRAVWPHFLRKAENLHLWVTIDKDWVDGYQAKDETSAFYQVCIGQFNFRIYDLQCFLSEGSSLRSLHVHLHDDFASPDLAGMWSDCLSPARLLAPSIRFTYTGTPQAVADELYANMTPMYEKRSTKDSLARYRVLCDEGEGHTELIARLSISPTMTSRIVASYTKTLDKIFFRDTGEFMTVDWHFRLEKALNALEKQLDKTEPRDFLTQVDVVNKIYERLVRCREAREAANAV